MKKCGKKKKKNGSDYFWTANTSDHFVKWGKEIINRSARQMHLINFKFNQLLPAIIWTG